jgi:hypothetical protein
MTQWQFTAVSLGKSCVCFVCVWALAPLLVCFAVFWRNANLAGDLRILLVVLCCCFLVVMICRVHATNSCPCTSMNSLFSGKDRASERQGPNSREKKAGTTAFQRHCSVLFWSLDALFVFGLPPSPAWTPNAATLRGGLCMSPGVQCHP